MVMTTVVAGRHAEPVAEPDEPGVPERASRRTYTAQYKLRVLAEYERCDRDGKGALLRHAPDMNGQRYSHPARARPRRDLRDRLTHPILRSQLVGSPDCDAQSAGVSQPVSSSQPV